MIYTTYNLAVKYHACARALTTWKKHMRAKFDADNLIPLTEVLKVLGLDDCLWALRTISPTVAKTISIKFAIACADRVLIHFESKSPNDKRPRQAIEAAQAYLLNPSKKTAYAADAAAYAAYAAAHAADAAEKKWQTAKLTELLEDN